MVARDGAEAIEQLESFAADDLKLVLLDLKLPKVGGYEVLHRIQDLYGSQSPPVVVFTSSDEPVDVQTCKQLGAAGFVTKPIDFEEYIQVIKSIAVQWLA